MFRIKRTNSENRDFIKLVKELDAYLAICDGDEHDFYDQFNKLDAIKNVIVLYENHVPVGCGAFKKYDRGIAEVKRMYVNASFRNKGYASEILRSLEEWAIESGFSKLILETGVRQFEAVNFYRRNGYHPIEKYPPYENMKNSLCFEKILRINL
ncbi:MAG: GNAT family N-acetyltransferase [Christiangramia sp.]